MNRARHFGPSQWHQLKRELQLSLSIPTGNREYNRTLTDPEIPGGALWVVKSPIVKIAFPKTGPGNQEDPEWKSASGVLSASTTVTSAQCGHRGQFS